MAIWNKRIKCPWKIRGMFWLAFAKHKRMKFHHIEMQDTGHTIQTTFLPGDDVTSEKWMIQAAHYLRKNIWGHIDISPIYSTIKRGTVPLAPQIRVTVFRRDYTPIFGGSGPLDGWINGSQVGLTPLPDPRHLPVVIARGCWGWGCSLKLRARVYFHELRMRLL